MKPNRCSFARLTMALLVLIAAPIDAAESGHASILVQDYLRLDPSASRFDAIAEQWTAEMKKP